MITPSLELSFLESIVIFLTITLNIIVFLYARKVTTNNKRETASHHQIVGFGAYRDEYRERLQTVISLVEKIKDNPPDREHIMIGLSDINKQLNKLSTKLDTGHSKLETQNDESNEHLTKIINELADLQSAYDIQRTLVDELQSAHLTGMYNELDPNQIEKFEETVDIIQSVKNNITYLTKHSIKAG